MIELGAGDALPPKQYTAERVAAKLSRLISDSRIARACQRTAALCAESRTAEEAVHFLESAIRGGGLSLIHVPVYFGDDPLGGLGAFGRWNVGPWVHDVQAMRHDLAL